MPVARPAPHDDDARVIADGRACAVAMATMQRISRRAECRQPRLLYLRFILTKPIGLPRPVTKNGMASISRLIPILTAQSYSGDQTFQRAQPTSALAEDIFTMKIMRMAMNEAQSPFHDEWPISLKPSFSHSLQDFIAQLAEIEKETPIGARRLFAF